MKSKICPRYLISTIPAQLQIDSQAGGDNKKQEQNKKFVSVSQYVLQFDFTRHFY